MCVFSLTRLDESYTLQHGYVKHLTPPPKPCAVTVIAQLTPVTRRLTAIPGVTRQACQKRCEEQAIRSECGCMESVNRQLTVGLARGLERCNPLVNRTAGQPGRRPSVCRPLTRSVPAGNRPDSRPIACVSNG